MSDITYCTKCGTPNEPDYKFCKNCGAPVSANQSTPLSSAEVVSQPCPPVNEPVLKVADRIINTEGFTIEGASIEEISLFVGKKAPKFFPKFASMHLNLTKTSWCWPPAILAFFLGPLGVAIWYFYRKMPTKALTFTVIATLIHFLDATLPALLVPDILADIPRPYCVPFDMITDFISGDINTLLSINNYKIIPILLLYFINIVVGFGILIFVGVFSVNTYKNHCISKISEYKKSNLSSPYYKLGLSSLGGTSSTMAWLGIAIMVAVFTIEEIIPEIIIMF